MTHGYDGYAAYGRSKLCNILFTRALAAGWRDTRAHGQRPATRLRRHRLRRRRSQHQGWLMNGLKVFAMSPEEGARTTLHLATSEEGAA